MKSRLLVPRNKQLRKYIQYFFFIRNEASDFTRTYTCYPNTNYCLGLHKGRELVHDSDNTFRIESSGAFHSYLTGIYKTPMTVHYSGAFSGVWINFEPLGLEMLSGARLSDNSFVNNAIEQIFPKSWQSIYHLAFDDLNPTKAAAKLENFFLKGLPDKNRFDFVPLNKLRVSKVDDLKEFHYMSYSSINRFYKNNLDISPKAFLEIQRFRRCVEKMHTTSSLTEIAMSEDFNDQSHMIKSFHKLTGMTPTQFRLQNLNITNKLVCRVD